MSKQALIADNLVSVLNGKSIQIGSESITRTAFAERQRLIFNSQGYDLYIEVCGPWPETLNETGSESHVALRYVVEAHIYKMNDTPPAIPATKQAEDVGETLWGFIKADITRGGNALLTRIDGLPYYAIVGDSTTPEFIIRLDLIVEGFFLII
ncbi:MAG: hypothetical protein PHN88_14840 [Ignavibacteria bacterium]|nr:hypothetical protein [Ignavibacteria bacterium]